MNKLQLLTFSLCALMAPVVNAKVKLTSQARPGKLDISASLDNARKSLAHFAESTEDRELAQTLSDISKILKTAKKNPTSITKKDVEHTFAAIEEITHKIDSAHDEAGLSDGCGCKDSNCCKELKKLLCQIRSIIEKCCKHLTEEIKEIKKLINRKFPCAHSIKIDHVPFVITKSGKYCVTKDLIFADAGAAITVAANNVSINFANHNLTLTNPAGIGISATGISELFIENDSISTPAPSGALTSAGITLDHVTKVSINNVFTENTFTGINVLNNSNDIKITNYHHKNLAANFPGAPAGVRIIGSVAVSIDQSTIELTSGQVGVFSDNIFVLGDSREISVTNCKFPIADSAIHVNQVNGLLVDNCLAIASPTTEFNILELGNVGQIAFNSIIRNSTFVGTNAAAGLDGVLLFNGANCLIENCVVDVRAASVGVFFPGAIHVGCNAVNSGCNPELSFDNVIVRNCVIKNSAEVGIFVEKGSNCVFENSLVTASVANIRFDNATECTVSNCKVNNGGGNGIVLNTGANINSFIGNIVSNNAGTGIVVNTGADSNHLQDNKVFKNGGLGINNLGTNTETYFNTSCNNVGDNCFGVTPEQTPGASPAVAGSNICCSQPV